MNLRSVVQFSVYTACSAGAAFIPEVTLKTAFFRDWLTFLPHDNDTLTDTCEINRKRMMSMSIRSPGIPLPQAKTKEIDFNLGGKMFCFFVPALSVLTTTTTTKNGATCLQLWLTDMLFLFTGREEEISQALLK